MPETVTGAAPAVSVVVPTYDRPDRLARCVESLRALDPPPGGFEVIIVDDGSPTPVAVDVGVEAVDVDVEEARSGHKDESGHGDGGGDDVDGDHRDPSSPPVRLHRQPNAGPAAARNAGAALARGALLAFTDDDCTPDRRWLVALVQAAVAAPTALLGGTTVNAETGDAYAEASQLLVDHVTGHVAGQTPFFPSNNIAMAASGFAAIAGFDTSFPQAAGEDRDLCARWMASGRPLARAEAAVIQHHHAFTLLGFLRQHHAYGRGGHRHQQVHTVASGGRVRPEPPAFYTALLRAPQTHGERGLRGLRLSALLVLSQVANASGYARQAVLTRREQRSDGVAAHRSVI